VTDEGFVPTAEDFAEMAAEMERERDAAPHLCSVDGRLVWGRIVHGVFTPRDRGALQEFAEEDQDKRGDSGWTLPHPRKEDE
jgi:hypothetical protein